MARSMPWMSSAQGLLEVIPNWRRSNWSDYKVRILEEKRHRRRHAVLLDASDGERRGTVGSSANIIEASWQALVDSIEYGMARVRPP